MPLTNYCAHCKTEVTSMGVCPHCGKRLAKASERLSFTAERRPLTDWFCWNAVLRVAVPALILVFLSAIFVTAVREGEAGVSNLLRQGLPGTLLIILLLLLGTLSLVFALQGRQTVRYVLDKEGAHAYICLRAPGMLCLWAHLTTRKGLQALQAEAPETLPDGLLYLRRTDVRWAQVRRVQYWPQTRTALLYKPRWWQAIAIRCPEAEYTQAVVWLNARVSWKRRRKSTKAKKSLKT